MPGHARSLLFAFWLLLLPLLAGGLVRPAPALAQAAPTAPAGAATPAPEAAPPAAPDPVAALDGILATLRNDDSRAAFVSDLEKLRASLAARGATAPAAPDAAAPAAGAPGVAA
ncbi:hypothetical protein MHZ93_16570, partial [Roseomonas sp. ACRSG]|nr:hypothetical protein [Roseomonas sp. ACRSG]